MESSLELSPSASSLRGRSFCRAGPRAGSAAPRRGRLRVLHGELSRALTFGLFVARPKLRPRGPSRPEAGGLLRAWLGGFSPRTPSRPSCFCRAGPRAPRQAGSFEPGSAASRRGRLRVLHGELSRALTFGLFVARRPLREPLSSSHFRPLRCEAEASAAGALAPRGWRAPSSLA